MTFPSVAQHGETGGRFFKKLLNHTNNNTEVKNLYRYFIDTTGGAVNLLLPESAPVGFKFRVMDYANTFATNNCTIKAGTMKINGINDDFVLDASNIEREFERIDTSTRGWIVRKVG